MTTKIPKTLKYTASHEWVRQEADGTLTLGITDHAQAALGDIVFVELPAIGQECSANEAALVVESVKAASDVYAPMAGEVVAVNGKLGESPEHINTDPYDAWLIRLKPVDPASFDMLLTPEAYSQLTGA